MKKVTKLLGTGLLAMSLFAGSGANLLASESVGVYGGWSESEGYYATELNRSSLLRATAAPKYHVGKRLTKVVNSGGDTKVAAYGETTWKDTYHYTTARMETSGGTVLSTSGRQWGTGYTEVKSLDMRLYFNSLISKFL